MGLFGNTLFSGFYKQASTYSEKKMKTQNMFVWYTPVFKHLPEVAEEEDEYASYFKK